MQKANCTETLLWILAACELELTSDHQLWAENIAARYAQLKSRPQLLQKLPKQLLHAVMTHLAYQGCVQKLKHEYTMTSLIHRRAGRASCKQTAKRDGSKSQVYHFFCTKVQCPGHMMQRITTGFGDSKQVHLEGTCHCSHAAVNRTAKWSLEEEERLPECMTHIGFDKTDVVDDTVHYCTPWSDLEPYVGLCRGEPNCENHHNCSNNGRGATLSLAQLRHVKHRRVTQQYPAGTDFGSPIEAPVRRDHSIAPP